MINKNKGVSILSYQLPYTLILVISYSITSNSKAAKGLLVYLEVNSICTAIPISLSQSLRQLLYRYIIHARPHLTARVFRYLRTLTLRPPLIGVSFKAKLILVNLANPLTSRHRAEITLNTLTYYLIAECFVLIKQSYNTIPCFLFFILY